ncbi:MAG TPA: UDP-N-acetylmuramoyl-L-alanyl-D-glutamate--2,6-diaminopimelate ligase [Myxococcota bacterium]|nr:UDP-N-acetylmuramoyl-L-alanyl-D-glutamate--2,6-diaminopimelate ligase [Myxococcota bacterium]
MTRGTKNLQELIEGVEVIHLTGDSQVSIGGLSFDSRLVKQGDLFVAVPGLDADGHDFLGQAAAAGASAAVVSRDVDPDGFAAVVRVRDCRAALAMIASDFFGRPSLETDLVGITGTNGKTTLTYLIEHIAREADLRPGVLGTIGVRWAGHGQTLDHTTPEAPLLQELLRQMCTENISPVAMEVSSHALSLERTLGCHFKLGVFTNLSRDHLDYHGDLENYARAKALLFSRELVQSRATDKAAVYNRDDPYWSTVVGGFKGRSMSFGFDAEADVHPMGSVHYALDGIEARVAYPGGHFDITGRLPGRHNLQNSLAAVAVALALGIEPRAIAKGIAACRVVPGRLQRVLADLGPAHDRPAVFVDYAHTDQALANVLSSLRPLTSGRLIVIFGCGGDRDRGKRPLMGKAVAGWADLAVVTSDNPRSEDPLAIIEQILPGLDELGFGRLDVDDLIAAGSREYAVIPDRSRAIAAAISAAMPDDVVVIAGKGHEDYQIVGTTRRHFDDCEQARKALGARPAGDER